jgi:hypothetical protein
LEKASGEHGSRMKVCDPMLGVDFGEIAAPGACLARRKTRPQSCPTTYFRTKLD